MGVVDNNKRCTFALPNKTKTTKMKKLKIVYTVSACGTHFTFRKLMSAIAFAVKNNSTVFIASYKNIEKGYKVEDFTTWKFKTEETIQLDFYCEVI